MAEKFPVFIKAKKDEVDHVYGFPSLDGESIKIVMENFDEYKTNFKNDIFEFQKLIPDLSSEVVKTSDCRYVVCPDSHFVVDYLD